MPIPKLFGTFIKDRRAYVAVVFGILALPLIAIAGAAVDYRSIGREQTAIRAAAEAAAVGAARSHFAPTSGGGGGVASEDPNTLMENIFHADYPNSDNKVENIELDYAVDDDLKTVTLSVTADAKTNLLQVIGFATFPISVSAKAAAVFSSENIDVHFVVDMSPSMGAPADGTAPPLNAQGCFFMCHDDGSTIRNAGKTPKMDVIRNRFADGTNGLLQTIEDARVANPIPINAFYTVFYFDHHLGPPEHGNTDSWDIMQIVFQQPYFLGNDGVNGGTDLKTSFQELHTYLNTTYPKPDNTRRIVIIVSDGMHARAKFPFDPAVCTALKEDGDIFTLYVKNSTSVYDNPNLDYVIPGGPQGGTLARDTWDIPGVLSNGGSSPYGYYTGLNNAEALMRNCATKPEWAYQGETQTQLESAITSMGEAIIAPTIRVIN